MKLLASIVTIVALVSSAEACQCLSNVGVNDAVTKKCCREAGGTPDGNQCLAGRISRRLSNFSRCCKSYGTLIDCGCPRGCANVKLAARHEAEGEAAPTEGEVRDTAE